MSSWPAVSTATGDLPSTMLLIARELSLILWGFRSPIITCNTDFVLKYNIFLGLNNVRTDFYSEVKLHHEVVFLFEFVFFT